MMILFAGGMFRGVGRLDGSTRDSWRRVFLSWVVVLTSAVASAGCLGGEGDEVGEPVPIGCNPLAKNWDCMLPYPTDFYTVEDSTLPSGRRVVIPKTALPEDESGEKLDFLSLHPADGFSHLSQIVALFPFSLDDSNLVFHTGDVTESLGSQSPTVLMEADTGVRVLHFAEMDPRAESDDRRALIIRPMERLKNGVRYIVAIRDLRTKEGEEVPPGQGFEMLRDGMADGDDELGPLIDHFESKVFDPLDQANIPREGLLLAWDFTVGTQEHLTSDMLAVRAAAMESFQSTPPALTVTQVDDDVDESVFRRVRGTMTVPLFMENDRAGAKLNRNGEGEIVQNGTAESDFTILIPRSVGEGLDPVRPARLIQYGHGFFGSRREAEGGYVTSFADRIGAVIIAVDWWGMSSKDVALVAASIISNPSETLMFTDRVHQGMVNKIAVTYAAKSTLMDLPEMKVENELVYDPDRIYYYGISQGHILGGTYIALSPHIERAALSVGGCSFPFMMMRSINFAEFLQMIKLSFADYLDQQKFVVLSQTVFDRIDPITYAPYVISEMLPDGPEQRFVLMQIGIGDPQVPNLASHLHARAVGVTHLTPAPRVVPALPTAPAPLTSALVELDFGIAEPLPGTYAIPPSEGNEVHEGVRRQGTSMDQIDAFLRPDGSILSFCEGPCDPQ